MSGKRQLSLRSIYGYFLTHIHVLDVLVTKALSWTLVVVIVHPLIYCMYRQSQQVKPALKRIQCTYMYMLHPNRIEQKVVSIIVDSSHQSRFVLFIGCVKVFGVYNFRDHSTHHLFSSIECLNSLAWCISRQVEVLLSVMIHIFGP